MSTNIGWTQETWVPFVGCDKVSPGCEHCYAIRMSWRLAHNPKTKHIYADTVKKTEGGKLNWTGQIKENLSQIDKPLRFKKPTMFFVNSMSDIFHDALTLQNIDELYDIMNACPQHIFQVLTKRHINMAEYYQWKEKGNGFKFPEWPLKNVWLGVSVENQKYADERIPSLLKVPAVIRFLSCEPLIGAVNLNNYLYADCYCSIYPEVGVAGCYDRNTPIIDADCKLHDSSGKVGLNWVIVGFESGPGSRPGHINWVRSLRDQCKEYNVPFSLNNGENMEHQEKR